MLIQKEKELSKSEEMVTVDVVAISELTLEEERDLLHLERQVERAFYSAGKALRELRDRRLYRSTHKSFEEYCSDRFGFQRRHCYQLIDAAQVVDNLISDEDSELCANGAQILPTSERQVRPLTPLAAEQQIEVWHRAVEETGGKLPSGRLVKDIVQRIRERTALPNPWRVGEVATILVKENPELRGKAGCWAIVTLVHPFGCTIKIWNGEYLVRIENLKELLLSPSQKLEVRQLGERLNRLSQIPELDRGAYPILESLGKQMFLTSIEEKLLIVLEEEYGLT